MRDDVVIVGSSGANLASLEIALRRLGVVAPVSEDPTRIAAADRVILPGVGAAADAMARLRRAKLEHLLPTLEQPVLGICLGMQLLFAASDEGDADCLGVIDARITRLPARPDLPVPHMGWNVLENLRDVPLLNDVDPGGYAYFVHSYAAPIGDYTVATTQYGAAFSAVVSYRNFVGTQFHPERSSALGAKILANFLRL